MQPERQPNPDRSPESLEARLRALPQPPVPADLEARLLRAIPAALSIPRRRWGVWVGAAGILAAACLLAVLAWPRRDDSRPDPGPDRTESAHKDTPQPPADDNGIAAWRQNRRVLEGEDPAPFSWPLPETPPIGVSTAIPADLLD